MRRYKSLLSSTANSSLPPEKPPKPKKPRENRSFDPTKYSTRFIALKFAYLGQRYNGLEYHFKCITPLPTVEEELWKALNKARLIFSTPKSSLQDREISWEGCDYSKCGRTDRGVSAFGQVVALRVRSNRSRDLTRDNVLTTAVDDTHNDKLLTNNGEMALPHSRPTEDGTASTACAANYSEAPFFHPIRDEIPYVSVLNHLLPPDIRVLAWCANPPTESSARFSCKERRYRYFFTQPAFTPTCGAAGIAPNRLNVKGSNRQREGWLDIEAMREGAKKFQGLNDFRNFCKVDDVIVGQGDQTHITDQHAGKPKGAW